MNKNITDLNNVEDILTFLLSSKDEKYKDFTSSLIPTVDKSTVIGVRTPLLRTLAKELTNTELMHLYLNTLPHKYLEENHLHGFLIENVRDFSTALKLTEKFLPYIDNWATCDACRPKVFKKDLDTLYVHIKKWLKSKDTYTVRYAVGLLNSFYLDAAFKEEHLSLVSGIKSDEYYIKMMIAWYFATALTKQYNTAIIYIENKVLPKWTHNKAISKACDSLRIDKDTKAYLRTFRIKP